MGQEEQYQKPIQQKAHTFKSEVWDIIKTIIFFGLIYFFVRGYIAQPFLVKGRSMEQTFSDGDYLIVDQVTYNFNDPKRFEIIVFNTKFIPGGSEREYYIKRIIGIPGDRVVIKEGVVNLYENNSEIPTILEEKYIIDGLRTLSPEPVDVLLEKDQYFVLGDNRGNSADSRYWGTLDRSYILGKPFIRLFPFNTIRIFNNNNE